MLTSASSLCDSNLLAQAEPEMPAPLSTVMIPVCLLLCTLPVFSRSVGEDLRAAYDVQSYRLDLRVDPARQEIGGTVVIEATVVVEELSQFVLDLEPHGQVQRVVRVQGELTGDSPLNGATQRYSREGARLICELAPKAKRGQRVALAVTYLGKPESRDRFSGVHWRETDAGEPWVDASCQAIGAHYWWPCKASHFHPEDKAARVFVNLTVPAGLFAVSNGRLEKRERQGNWETFHWQHNYPIQTYAVALNIGPFKAVRSRFDLAQRAGSVDFDYYVLADALPKAIVQFEQVPTIVNTFERLFGTYPFKHAKLGIVQSTFVGMDHPTAISYGSTFPAYLAKKGLEDPSARYNRDYDYILVHELAHEWWGNSVTASSWADYWLHEGFATYAESLYLEDLQGRAAADAFFERMRERISPKHRLHWGKNDRSASKSYNLVIYYKGAWALNMMRHYIDNDHLWWETLSQFHARHKHGNANTEDFQRTVEDVTGQDFERFFAQWVYGTGFPRLEGHVASEATGIHIEIENAASDGRRFELPLDIEWTEGGLAHSRRLLLQPGRNVLDIECGDEPLEVAVVGTHRLLGRHRICVR